METEVKNRTWVKDAAIVFLAVLLVLTFFSRTILNASLTEVATQEVKSGTITAKVRGTGKVVANGSNKIKAKGTVTIAKVMVKTGAEVKTGDILFVLGAGDSAELEAAKENVLKAESAVNDRQDDEFKNLNAAKQEYDACVAAYDALLAKGSSEYAAYMDAQDKFEQAELEYKSQYASIQDSLYSEGQAYAVKQVEIASLAAQIERQKEKIKELSGEGDNNVIEAKTAGTVTEINCASGDTVAKDDILAVIEVADMGYTVSFSVTNDQARRLRVGDEATISNFYWGNEIKAKLKSIATDKENPQNKKVLTFDLEGNVTAGAELTISVGQKSANYDLVVPNSAIRSDKNGKFVLAVEAKNSPLGNRYMAKRVKVDVLAEDDTNSAVTAELESGDFVITTSSAPIKSGEQVRLADSQ